MRERPRLRFRHVAFVAMVAAWSATPLPARSQSLVQAPAQPPAKTPQALEAERRALEELKRLTAEAEARHRAEDELRRLAAEVEARRRAADAEAKRQAEGVRKLEEDEAKAKAQQRATDEAKAQELQRAAEEAKAKELQRAAEEAKATEQAKEQAKEQEQQRAAEEAKRKAAEAAAEERRKAALAEAQAAEEQKRRDALPPPAPIPAPEKLRDATRYATRARALLGEGNVAAARGFLERAADLGSSAAAFELAETYDPQRLRKWPIVGVAADVERAAYWYRKAQALGSHEADDALRQLKQ